MPTPPIAQTEQGINAQTKDKVADVHCPLTESITADITSKPHSADEIIDSVGQSFKLNEMQWVAFKIIARSFVHRYVEGIDSDDEPLCMLMTGPGGTGKLMLSKQCKK